MQLPWRFCRVFCCFFQVEREQPNVEEVFLSAPPLLHLGQTLCFVERVATRKLTAGPGVSSRECRSARCVIPVFPQVRANKEHDYTVTFPPPSLFPRPARTSRVPIFPPCPRGQIGQNVGNRIRQKARRTPAEEKP